MQLERMVRVYFLLQWCVSDPGMEESLYDIELERRLAGIELGEEEIIDETAILNFHHLLEQHQLTVKLLDEVNGNLCENKLLLKPDTIVDALIPEHANREPYQALIICLSHRWRIADFLLTFPFSSDSSEEPASSPTAN